MGRKPSDSKATHWLSLLLLLMGFVSCSLVYMGLSMAFKSKSILMENASNSEGKCSIGIEHLELWGAAVKWGSDFKFNTSEECCRACKAMCSGDDGPCLCNTWVFCGNKESCGPIFGEEESGSFRMIIGGSKLPSFAD